MGHPVHPRGFRVGKSLPWHFSSHRYDFDAASFFLKELALTRLMRRRFLRFFPLRRFGLVPGIPRLTMNQSVITVIFPIFNSAYDIFLRRYRYRRFMQKRRTLVRRRVRKPKAGSFRLINRHRRYRHTVRRYLRLLRRYRRRYFGKKYLVHQYQRYHKPKLKLPRWHRRALRRDPSFKPKPRVTVGVVAPKLNPKKFRATSLTRFLLDPMARGRFRRQTSFRLRRRCHLLLCGLRREIRSVWPQRIRIKILSLHFGNASAKLLTNYVVRRFRLGYKVNRIVYPLLAEARRMPSFRGLFFRFKGRLSRKARASLNSRSFRFGRIGFATVDSAVDYASQAFETRYGVCTVQIWVAHRDPSPETLKSQKERLLASRVELPMSLDFGNWLRMREHQRALLIRDPSKALPPPRPYRRVRQPWQQRGDGQRRGFGKKPWDKNINSSKSPETSLAASVGIIDHSTAGNPKKRVWLPQEEFDALKAKKRVWLPHDQYKALKATQNNDRPKELTDENKVVAVGSETKDRKWLPPDQYRELMTSLGKWLPPAEYKARKAKEREERLSPNRKWLPHDQHLALKAKEAVLKVPPTVANQKKPAKVLFAVRHSTLVSKEKVVGSQASDKKLPLKKKTLPLKENSALSLGKSFTKPQLLKGPLPSASVLSKGRTIKDTSVTKGVVSLNQANKNRPSPVVSKVNSKVPLGPVAALKKNKSSSMVSKVNPKVPEPIVTARERNWLPPELRVILDAKAKELPQNGTNNLTKTKATIKRHLSSAKFDVLHATFEIGSSKFNSSKKSTK